MDIEINVLEEYINCFANTNSSQKEAKLSINISSDTALMYCTGSTVCIGESSIPLTLLFSCFAQNPKLFSKILFYYYWAVCNLSSRRLDSSARCCFELHKELFKKSSLIRGYAHRFNNALSEYYLVGHEATHICFRLDSEYRERAINEVLSIFEYVNESINTFPRRIQRVLLAKAADGFKIRKLAEEYACDRESLKFLYRNIIEPAELGHDTLIMVLKQIMDMTAMLQYDISMQALKSFNLRRENFNSFLSNHVAKGVMRCANAAMTLSELSGEHELVMSFFKDCVNTQQNMSINIFAFGLGSVGVATRSDEICYDSSKLSNFSSFISGLTDYMLNILLGEV